MADVHMYPTQLEALLNSPGGPVGQLVFELSVQASGTARALAPVMKQRNYSHFGSYFDPRYQYGPPGETRRSVHWSGWRYNARGQLYSGVNVNYGPTLFLERPARQVRPVFMFMTEALDSVHL